MIFMILTVTKTKLKLSLRPRKYVEKIKVFRLMADIVIIHSVFYVTCCNSGAHHTCPCFRRVVIANCGTLNTYVKARCNGDSLRAGTSSWQVDYRVSGRQQDGKVARF
jgi:hypothetical protein